MYPGKEERGNFPICEGKELSHSASSGWGFLLALERPGGRIRRSSLPLYCIFLGRGHFNIHEIET
jgi:hypothetical protein